MFYWGDWKYYRLIFRWILGFRYWLQKFRLFPNFVSVLVVILLGLTIHIRLGVTDRSGCTMHKSAEMLEESGLTSLSQLSPWVYSGILTVFHCYPICTVRLMKIFKYFIFYSISAVPSGYSHLYQKCWEILPTGPISVYKSATFPMPFIILEWCSVYKF